MFFEEAVASRMRMVDSVVQVGSILISTRHVAMELKTIDALHRFGPAMCLLMSMSMSNSKINHLVAYRLRP